MGTNQKFKLSDLEWNRIAETSSLPAEARQIVEEVIALFRRFEKTNRNTAYETRGRLQALRKHALSLHKKLLKVINIPDAHYALTVFLEPARGWPPSHFSATRLDGHRRLEHSMQTIEELARWLALARERVPSLRSGASRRAANILWLVGSLDAIWQKFTRRKITRSNKRNDLSRQYITTVCHIADSKIMAGTIEHAMQRHIKLTRRSR